jgi:hypothetical protein
MFAGHVGWEAWGRGCVVYVCWAGVCVPLAGRV